MKSDDERRARELERLDALLDEQPAPRVPDGLAERVLAAVAEERASRGAGRGARPRLLWVGAPLAAAAALALWFGTRPDAAPEGPTQVAGAPGASGELALPAEPELLRELELLEDWELLVTDDLDLLLAELDEVDEALLDGPTEEVEQG